MEAVAITKKYFSKKIQFWINVLPKNRNRCKYNLYLQRI